VYAIRHLLWLPVPVLVLSLAACAIPGGASIDAPDTGQYQVEVPYKQVDFSVATPPQTAAGVTATVSVDSVRPVLYYSYSVSSQVNGGYVGLPNPPMSYTVRKVPFYRTDPDAVTVRIELQNSTGEVVRASQAVCSFDLDGRTVASTPLGATDLMPGHSLSLEVRGPSLDSFSAKAGGSMTVWLYGLTADKNQTLHWQANYTVIQENRHAWGEIVGVTSSASEAARYKDMVEPAGPDALVNTPPGG